MTLRSRLLDFAYRGEVFFSRVQGIAYGDPRRNGEYRLVRRLAPCLRGTWDVGANVGDWTAEVLRATDGRARVHCLEPAPGNAELLRRRFAGQPNVTVHERAASSAPGRLAFHSSGVAASGDGYLDSNGSGDLTVDVTSLDALAAEHPGAHFDLVKVDVEGEEMRVLLGARGLFRERRIGSLQLEYNNTWLRTGFRLRDVHEFAASHGYTLLCAGPLAFMRLDGYGEGLEDYRYRNLILAREDHLRRLGVVPPAGRARVELLRNGGARPA